MISPPQHDLKICVSVQVRQAETSLSKHSEARETRLRRVGLWPRVVSEDGNVG